MSAPLTPKQAQARVLQLINQERWLSQIVPSIPVGLIRPKLLNELGVTVWRGILRLNRKTNAYAVDRAARSSSDAQRREALELITQEHVDRINRDDSSEEDSEAEVILKKTPNRSQFEQEVDDAISRATSYIGWEQRQDIISSLQDEIRVLLLVDPSGELWCLPRRPKEISDPVNLSIERAPGTVVSAHEVLATGNERLVLQFDYPQVAQSLRKVYPDVPSKNLAVLVLICRVQRTDGGSNWSPSLSYPGLQADYDSGKVGVLESFSGMLNFQNLIFQRQVTHARLALEWKLIVTMTGDTGIVGSWPDDFIPQAHELRLGFPRVRLLVNPPYSNPEIERVVTVLNRLFLEFKEYPETKVLISMTLPDWDDLYAPGGTLSKLRGCYIASNIRHTKDIVRNFSSSSKAFETKLKYRALVIKAGSPPRKKNKTSVHVTTSRRHTQIRMPSRR